MKLAWLITVCALLLLAASPSLGGGRGYWECEGGDWRAVGHPLHSRPLRQCDVPTQPLPQTRATCLAEGGTWGPIGIFPAAV